MDTKKTLSETLEAQKNMIIASLVIPRGNWGAGAYNEGKIIALFGLDLITYAEYKELSAKYGTDSIEEG